MAFASWRSPRDELGLCTVPRGPAPERTSVREWVTAAFYRQSSNLRKKALCKFVTPRNWEQAADTSHLRTRTAGDRGSGTALGPEPPAHCALCTSLSQGHNWWAREVLRTGGGRYRGGGNPHDGAETDTEAREVFIKGKRKKEVWEES